MRKVLTTGSFLVFSLLGLSYIFTFFGMPSEVPTPEPRLQKTQSEGFGTAIAQTHRAMPVSYPVEDFTAGTAYKIVRVIDGDTVKIDYNGKATNVRLIGVDTPETVHPSKPVEAYGKEVSNFTKNLLLGESVYLRFDAERTDTYGRLLRHTPPRQRRDPQRINVFHRHFRGPQPRAIHARCEYRRTYQ